MSQEFPGALSSSEIEKLFIGIAGALRVRIKIVEIGITSDGCTCHIRSHDAYGRLPDIRAPFGKDKNCTLDDLSIRIAQLGMTVRLRQELANRHRGCRFLPPTLKKKTAWAGIRTRGKTIAANGQDFCRVYQELIRIAGSLCAPPMHPEITFQAAR
jgi:hypothetical protein